MFETRKGRNHCRVLVGYGILDSIIDAWFERALHNDSDEPTLSTIIIHHLCHRVAPILRFRCSCGLALVAAQGLALAPSHGANQAWRVQRAPRATFAKRRVPFVFFARPRIDPARPSQAPVHSISCHCPSIWCPHANHNQKQPPRPPGLTTTAARRMTRRCRGSAPRPGSSRRRGSRCSSPRRRPPGASAGVAWRAVRRSGEAE